MNKKILSIVSILILLGIMIVASVASFRFPEETPQPEQQPVVQKDFPLQDFELVNLEGNAVKLSDFRDRWVVLNFWATWCPPCRQEMPLLEEVSKELSPELVVLGVNSMEADNEVRSFVETNNLSFMILFDGDGRVEQQYLIHGLPTTLFIDKNGVLKIRHVGVLTRSQVDEYLLELGVFE